MFVGVGTNMETPSKIVTKALIDPVMLSETKHLDVKPSDA
jgi:hypothetical protein